MRHNMQLAISFVTLPCKERVKLQLSATPRIKISIGLQLALTSNCQFFSALRILVKQLIPANSRP